MSNPTRVIALSGGVGGAKLALGLSRALAPGALMVVANVGDDFEHLGLTISPDSDTLMYVLGGVDDAARGWGRREETWTFMAALEKLGGETWFKLGDGDLAVHVERTRRIRQGEPLSQVTVDFCRRLGIKSLIVPATDDPVRTKLQTDIGELDFQDYFVRRGCAPVVSSIRFAGAEIARPNPTLLSALSSEHLAAIVICPSNPFISIEPILAISGLRSAIVASRAPVVAVSPIIGGRAVKGPTAKMLLELGLPVCASGVAKRYEGILNGYILDEQDAHEAQDVQLNTTKAKILMQSLSDRDVLARVVLDFASEIASKQ
jgi:LPPG:FO 2-phospho-L-lactate transferase